MAHLVVSMHAFNLNAASSNPVEIYKFYCAKLFERNEDERKRGPRLLIYLKRMNEWLT